MSKLMLRRLIDDKRARFSRSGYFIKVCEGVRGKNHLGAGQSLVEFVLLVPLLIFLIVNAVNWGGFIFAWVTVANAARTGAQYAVLDRAAAGAPAAAIASQITSLINGDFASLVNNPSLLTINICNNYNGTVTTVSGTCTAVPADPVAANYVLTSVDVTYTFRPFIPLFPVLGLNFTLGNKSIHRRTQMRRLQ